MEYGFITRIVDFDGEKVWVAESTDLNGCIGQGDSAESAIAELAENEKFWLEIAKKRGFVIPKPSVVKEQMDFSGKLTLRLGKRVHAETAKRAKEDGLSINQYITDAVVTYNTRRSVESLSAEVIKAVSVKSVSNNHPYKFSFDPFEKTRSTKFNIVKGANYAV